MQPNSCRSWRWAEEKATWVCGHGCDQEVELMVQATSLWWMVEELAVGGRESKKRRRKWEGLQIGERNWRWLLVVGWWLCWLPVVELVVTRMAGRERERKNCRNGSRGAGFWPTLDQIFSFLGSWNRLLFIGGGSVQSCLH